MTVRIKEVRKHGNLILDTSFEAMNEGGIEVGDIITVLIKDREYDLPVGTAYTDVDSGELFCRFDLDDSVETMKNYSTYPGSYYSKCAVINPEMNYDFAGKEFGEKVSQSIRFIIDNEEPCLIHCKEGKDRTGILCAILECFAGATADDVKRDYMITYYNFYNVQPEDAAYSIILNNNLVKTLCSLYEIDDLEEADLKEEAEQYLRAIGLTPEQLTALEEKLNGR